MKSLQKIQFLKMHLLQLKHPSTTNNSRRNKWNHNPEYWVRSTICSFKSWWKWNRSAYNEQQRPIHEDSSEEDSSEKRLPLISQPVGSLAPVCQKGGEGEIYQRYLPSLQTLLSLEDGGPVREISLLRGLPVSQQTQVRDTRVLPKVVKIAVQ